MILRIYNIDFNIFFALLSIIGFIDDYIKVFKKRKSGINSWVKIIGQTILGCLLD